MEDLFHRLLGEEEIGTAVVADEETETVGMALDAAAEQVGLVGQQPVFAAVLHQLPVAGHGAEAALEVGELVRRHLERLGQAGQ